MEHFSTLPLDVQRLIVRNLTIEEHEKLCAKSERRDGICSDDEDAIWSYRIEDEYKLYKDEQFEIIKAENLPRKFKALWSHLKRKESSLDAAFFKKWEIWNKYMASQVWLGKFNDKETHFEYLTKDERFLERYINITDRYDEPVLYHGVFDNDRNRVSVILKAGPDVDGLLGFFTPLMLAIRKNRQGLVEDLIRAGANVNFKSPGGWKPLDIALRYSKGEIIKMLQDAGASG